MANQNELIIHDSNSFVNRRKIPNGARWSPLGSPGQGGSPARKRINIEYQARMKSPTRQRGGFFSEDSDDEKCISYRENPSKHSAGVRSSETSNDSVYSDRFIPSRSASQLGTGYSPFHYVPDDSKRGSSGGNLNNGDNQREQHCYLHNLLRNELLGAENVYGGEKGRHGAPPNGCPSYNILKYKSCKPSFTNILRPSTSLSPISQDASFYTSPRVGKRKISRAPFKILDAPSLHDDFYLNLVDWSSLNVLAVGLGTTVYLWSACTSKVTKLCEIGEDDHVTSVSWTQRGTHLAVGTHLGGIQIWDTIKCKRVRTMEGHSTRVGTLAWNAPILASGSRDRQILLRDVRVPEPYIRKLVGHKQEVCGLRWSFDESQLASGGNDNKLLIWNAQSSTPVSRFNQHSAAVKAIAWSPHQHGLLASGGGTADRCIRFWNSLTESCLNCIDTGSQVCNLIWSKNLNEIVSTHGYSLNQIIVWRYPSMSKVATLTGHTCRVLYLAMSPDGQTIVTGAGDETLRFWNTFPGLKNKDGSRLGNSLLFPAGADIR